MRKATLMTAALVGAMVALPAAVPAQVRVSVAVGARLGPEIGVFAYSVPRYGAWRAAYVRWTPVIVYEYRGHFYPHAVSGARAVAVYRYHDEYFLPPRDAAWVGFDRRFDYRRQPVHEDWGYVRGHVRDDHYNGHHDDHHNDHHNDGRTAHPVPPGGWGR